MKILFSFLLVIASFFASAQIDEKIPARPNPPKLVNDFTGTLTKAQTDALNNKLIAYDDSSSSQIAVVVINTLDGADIADYGLRLGRKWGIGGSEFNNGVLLIVAKEDKKVRIEVGYGLEGAIPDITAKHIIDEAITPNFKQGNFYRGLDNAVDDIIKAAAGEYKAPAGYSSRKNSKRGASSLIAAIVFIVILIAMGGGRSSGGGGGTMSAAGWIIGSLLSSGGRGGGGGWSGGGGGGGGGGFGGFGGGSFGGGGASGSW